MSENEFIQISNLFNSLGIIEKGIEKIYHHLLKHKRIDNLKRVCHQYNLSLKRGYKIASVLSDLELVYIYDRPMKINLATPLIPLWQKLVNNRIEELHDEFLESKKRCEVSLEEFIKEYNLKSSETPQEPIEFLNFDLRNFQDMYYPFLAEKSCKIALGIRYENPLITFIQRLSVEDLENELSGPLIGEITKIKNNLARIDIQVIFNNELIKELLQTKEFKIVSKQINSIDFEFKTLDVHITEENFSNFSLTDSELIQPSFDPSNKLIGSYISRNENIYQIFEEKFNEIFEKGVPINEYIQESLSALNIEPLSDKNTFSLCLL
ncbi:MAG: hypothetical protein GF383_04570 [Candidatus Lokiarchaeota archaeon]|nr:hypothetical protein [Candidatus Lokiarchaeota archaeon]MBD3339059.1 hypothetical protein [Candidatus Lokiarchaeota archaeon]